MTIEFNKQSITIDNIYFFDILAFLEDKVDKRLFNEIASPNFYIVVRPSERTDFEKKEGDYDIVIRKENGEENTLYMPHRGAKMLYVLTLFCQKAVGGLPNKYFKNKMSAAVIKALFDKLYRSGGDLWVYSCSQQTHNISNFRTHAKSAVEKSQVLDGKQRYWCGFENEKRTIKMHSLQLRRIRIPSDRILFEDAKNCHVSFDELLEQLPPLEELFQFRRA